MSENITDDLVSTCNQMTQNKSFTETFDCIEPCSSKGDGTSTETIDMITPCSSTGSIFHSKQLIPCVPINEQETVLLELGVSVYDQDQFENETIKNVERSLKEQELKRIKDNAKKEIYFVEADIKLLKKNLKQIEDSLSKEPNKGMVETNSKFLAIRREKEKKCKQLELLEEKHKKLEICISRSVDEVDNDLEASEENIIEGILAISDLGREKLVCTTEMTGTRNFSIPDQIGYKSEAISIPETGTTDFDIFLLGEANRGKEAKNQHHQFKKQNIKSSQTPTDTLASEIKPEKVLKFTDLRAVSRKKKKAKVKLGSKKTSHALKKNSSKTDLIINYKSDSEISEFEIDEDDVEMKDDANNYSDDDVYIPEEDGDDDDSDYSVKGKPAKKKKCLSSQKSDCKSDDKVLHCKFKKKAPVKSKAKKIVDDGNVTDYIKRIKTVKKAELVEKHKKILESEDGIVSDEDDCTEIDENYKIPNIVWNKLYPYQQTCVRWLWELHGQNCGGIMGDEMGLGKTIQLIAFLIGLKFSKSETLGDSFRGLGPVILVCPATVMHQWVKEFHTWWPPFRVAVLHESGSFNGKKENLVHSIIKSQGVLITSYAGIVQHKILLLKHVWHYMVLDEGHKIRNPNAKTTIAVKQFRTPHRIILSGSPIQNNLKELWSLFDFIFPGKLGTLPVFMEQFSVPIVLGGYATASDIQVQIAYKCATVLRDTISPYLLRRLKSDVKMNINLPDKNEQVLFCQMTEEQTNLYKSYIDSKEVNNILSGRFQVFVGLTNLRKICNHPDLFDGGPKILINTDISKLTEEEKFGFHKRSGKMIVLEALLRLWHTQGHRVLLFTQSLEMMNIFESFVQSKNYAYMKMDGMTSIASRQPAIDKFNSDPAIFVFLLTTRVGGIGVNLTGADRVILYDPDWNPSTDSQARERAWRIGQKNPVTVYRFLTAGTIEEKMYHRQIFKQFLTQRVLKDPRQRRFFKSNDLCELFTYNEVGKQGTETSAIFAGTGSVINPKDVCRRNQDKEGNKSCERKEDKRISISFSEEKREEMRLLAKKLSSEFAKKITNVKLETSKTAIQESSPVKEGDSLEENGKSLRIESSKKVLRKKKKKTTRIEGKRIDFVVKRRTYKPSENAGEKSLKQDEYVLSKLFKSSSVHTALKHDKIMESSAPDYVIVENEANRVANEAIKALKNSRQLCTRAESGIPTWTGKYGGVKKPRFGQKRSLPFRLHTTSEEANKSLTKPSSSKLFGGQKVITSSPMSSSDLLTAIRKRKLMLEPDFENDDSSTLPVDTVFSEHAELLSEIKMFVAFGSSVDGQTTTKEILETFKDKVPIEHTALFKALLTKICDFTRSSSGEGIWHLKTEFR